jgi:two-component system sensor histidine kinase HydH
VTRASDLLVRGQVDVVSDRLRGALRELEGPATGAELGRIVDELTEEGLRYVGIFDVGGAMIAEGGTRVGAPRPTGLGRDATLRLDADRVRVERRAPGRGPRRERGPGPMPAGPTMVIELEPAVATATAATARDTLVVGTLAAGGFLIVALFLVRWLLRREVNERRREHERRLASLGRMSAVLAHEIKNPLASLKGNAQLLARALPDSDKPRAKADRVVNEAIRLETLVNGLLEFARTGALHRAEVDPTALAREIAAAPHAAGRVTVEDARAPARWSLDPERLREVLSNLVENAVQAGGGPVALSVALDDGDLVYAVRDHGPGVPPDDLERIFEPFTTTRTHGTGLGLAVARRFVELHGGTLTAENMEGGGARFTARIPR